MIELYRIFESDFAVEGFGDCHLVFLWPIENDVDRYADVLYGQA